MKQNKDPHKLLAQNKKAYHEYFIEESYEAGIALVGTEVKSIRKGSLNLKDGFVRIMGGEAFLINVHISPYEKGNIFNRDPLRTRKLLLHKQEIMKLIGKLKQSGYTLVPLRVYLKNGLVKVQVGLARGKQLYDKREDIAKKDVQREMARKLKDYNKTV